MKLGLVIPSVGRPDDLMKALTAASNNASMLNDVVVVARKDDEPTQRAAKSLGVRVALVERPGLAWAMRVGAQECDADAVAFSDDDAAVRPGWAERLAGHYESPTVGGVGGRDFQVDGAVYEVTDANIGQVTRSGRVIGGHHMATGSVREVSHLKGANCSFRKEPFLEWNVQERINGSGAQTRNELVVCLGIKSLGYRLLFDPGVIVDHYPAQRAVGDQRAPSAGKVYEAAYNETLAFQLSRHPLRRRNLVQLAVIGYGTTPGAARLLGGASKSLVSATLRGVRDARRAGRKVANTISTRP